MLMKTMETKNAGLGPETTTTTPSTRAEGAKSMLERVAAWELEIPVFDFPVPEGDRRALMRGRLVPPDFVEEITAVMQSAELASRGAHAEEVHDLMEYSVVYGPVATAIERLGAKMRHSVDTARAKAGAEALLTFSVVERLSQVPGTKHLAPTVEALRRSLRTVPMFRRSKKSKKEGTETPAPAPAPAPVPVVTAPVPVAVDPHKP